MIEFYAVKILTRMLLPPGLILTLFLCGLGVRRRWRRTGQGMMIASGVLLYLFSLLPLATEMREFLYHRYPPLAETSELPPRIGAIVVLGGGMRNNPEFGGLDVGLNSLFRLRYGARLHRETGLPLLVTANEELANAMHRVLEGEFHVPVRWVERESYNTADNVRLSRRILEKEGIDSVLLVTSESHMRRAVGAFEKEGVEVFPAPTLLLGSGESLAPGLHDWLPVAGALYTSSNVLYEAVGRTWYWLRYGSVD